MPVGYDLADFKLASGIDISASTINNNTTIYFAPDANGESTSVTLDGVVDSDLSNTPDDQLTAGQLQRTQLQTDQLTDDQLPDDQLPDDQLTDDQLTDDSATPDDQLHDDYNTTDDQLTDDQLQMKLHYISRYSICFR